jgi:hypothetical protein
VRRRKTHEADFENDTFLSRHVEHRRWLCVDDDSAAKLGGPTDQYPALRVDRGRDRPHHERAPEIAANLNTRQLGNLGLNDGEEKALVSFLKTLTDGYVKGTE